MKKFLSAVLALIFGLSCVLALILCAAQGVIFNTDRFMAAYEKENISEVTGMDEENLRLVTDHMLDYLCDKEEDFNLTAVIHGESRLVFDDREVAHMKDVKVLFMKAFAIRTGAVLVAIVSLILIIVLMRRSSVPFISWGYLLGLVVFGAILAILGYIVSQDFNAAFIKFHHIFFTNDLWLLDPTYEVLIQMLPESFFFSVAVALLIWGGLILIVPALIAIVMLIIWAGRNRKKKA